MEWPFRWLKIGGIAIQLVENWWNGHSTGLKLVEWAFNRLKIGGMAIQQVENWLSGYLTATSHTLVIKIKLKYEN